MTGRRATGKDETERDPQTKVLHRTAFLLLALFLAAILSGQILSGCATTEAPDMPERGPFGGWKTIGGSATLESYGSVPDGWTLRPVSEAAFSEAGGDSVRFEALLGGPVVVNKWATWCPPCVEEIGSLQSLHEGSREETSVVLVSQEDAETVRRFAERRGFSVPMYVADEMPASLEGETIPRTYVVKPDREVVYRHAGAADWNADEVYRFLGRFETASVDDASSAN